jgi:hypothetical protein
MFWINFRLISGTEYRRLEAVARDAQQAVSHWHAGASFDTDGDASAAMDRLAETLNGASMRVNGKAAKGRE